MTVRPIPPRRKYRNVPTIGPDGTRFHSKAEAARDADLQYLALAGDIRALERQAKLPLKVNGVKVADLIADWRYEERVGQTWLRVIEDKKGGKATQTPVFRLKWKLAQALYPSINSWRLS